VDAARRANAQRLLRPRSVAFIGGSVAPRALAICRDAGFTGPIYAVHPNRPEIEGVATVPRVGDLPSAPDAAFLAVPADATIRIAGELAAIGAGGAVCYAAGFAETGAVDAEQALVEAAGPMALLGPNCYGLINRIDDVSLWPVPYPGAAPDRGVALVLQSGNLGINITNAQRSLPIAFLVSVGNQAQLDVADAIDLLLDQPETTGIGVYLEGLRSVEAFSAAAARALAHDVPICVVKAGVSDLGTRLAQTHTSSLAGADELYDAAFHRLGVARAGTIPAMLETLKATTTLGPLRGRRVMVFTCSGGESALSADAAESAGLVLAQPSPPVAAALASALPSFASVANPLDYNTMLWGQEEALTAVFTTALGDPHDAALLVIDYPPRDSPHTIEIDHTVSALRRAATHAGVPAAVASTLPESFPQPARERALRAGVAPLQGLTDAFAALAGAAAWGERRRTPRVGIITGRPPRAGRLRDEWDAKHVLAELGLVIPAGRLVDAAAASDAADELGYPVCVKLCSAALPHKQTVGAVTLGLRSAGDVADAVTAMLSRVAPIAIRGVLVERMIGGVVAELVVGVKRDAAFGPVVVVGAGGSLVELIRDASVVLLPAVSEDIDEALGTLRIWQRIVAAGDAVAARDAVVRVAAFAHTNRDRLNGLDINPLMVLGAGDGVVVADALLDW
jgi:acetate---CoA ligase (ADP-forming)